MDVKVCANAAPGKGNKTIGYDDAGVVRQVGNDVRKFKMGDEVFYAGDIKRPGANSEFHAVAARVVGKKPKSLVLAANANYLAVHC